MTAHLLLTPPTGDQARVEVLRAAAGVAARRGAPGAAVTRLRRALAESPGEQERGEILTDLGRYEVATMQFEAAEEHLHSAATSGAEPTIRADAASALGRCAIVSGGRSAEAAVDVLASLADQLRPLDLERSLELSSELLMVAPDRPAPACRVRRASRALSRAGGRSPRLRGYSENPHGAGAAPSGKLGRGAVEEVQAALATGLPPAAATNAGFLAMLILELGERYDQALQLLDIALEGARREGHATRQGIIHGHRAAIALAQGSLHDAQIEAETGLMLVEQQHFVFLQLLAVALVVHVERGELEAAAELAQAGEAVGIAEDRLYLDQYLVARGRLRIAQGQLREGVADLMWCGQRLEAYDLRWPSDWKAFAAPALASLGETQTAARLAREQLTVARRVGAPGALGLSLRTAGLAIGGEEGLALLEEAVSVLEPNAARLQLAHALADLGAAAGPRRTPPGRASRRAEGDPVRRGVRCARAGGARPGGAACRTGASTARGADGTGRADRFGVARVPAGDRGPHQP